MEILYKPLGAVLQWLSNIFGGNFAAAVFFFTLLINLVMLPLTIKSQKSTANQARLKPKLEALKKKCGDDKVKYNQEMQALYQRENVSAAGGCLPMIIRLVIMLGVFEVINGPIRYLAGIDANIINDAIVSAKNAGLISATASRPEFELFNLIKNGSIELAGVTAGDLGNINFNLFGLDLGQMPTWSWKIFEDFRPIWLIPIFSFISSIASSLVSLAMQNRTNPDAPNMMGMMLLMPIMSLVIAFSVPGTVGFYWIVSNIISTGIQTVVQFVYGPNKIIARDQISAIVAKNKAEQQAIKKLDA